MYQEVAFLAGSTEFPPFHFPLENQQKVITKKGVFFKRQRLLRRPNEGQEENDLSAVINVGGIRYRIPWSVLEEFPLTRLGRLRGCSSLDENMKVCDDYNAGRQEYFFDQSLNSSGKAFH